MVDPEERIKRLERERALIDTKVATMLRALHRVPLMLECARKASGGSLTVGRDEARAELEAFTMQLRQFEMPTYSVEQAEAIDKRLSEMGAFALAREEVTREFKERVATMETAYRDLEEREEAERMRIRQLWEKDATELRGTLAKSEALSAKRRASWIKSYKRANDYLGVFAKLVDICRGFEGPLAEQVRRACVRELDRWAEALATTQARRAAGNPGSRG